MFYSEEEIATSLVCPRCETKFVDPRIIVPCFETLCINCIEDLTVTNNTEINCHFCRRRHPIPENGFALNKTIITQLLDKKPNEIYRASLVEALNEKINRVKDRKDELKSKWDASATEINEFCREIKTQIDLVVETKKKMLDDMRDVYLKRVDSYKQECLVNLAQFDSTSLLAGLEQANKFVDEISGYLKSLKTDQDVRQKSFKVEQLAHLDELVQQLKLDQFNNGQLLRFKANNISVKMENEIGFLQLEDFSKNSAKRRSRSIKK
jgi:hypothetical protein